LEVIKFEKRKKYCAYCRMIINEFDDKVKWAMMITKQGQKIISFECFHNSCWKKFWDENIAMEIDKFRFEIFGGEDDSINKKI
jgi:hypothetical protein